MEVYIRDEWNGTAAKRNVLFIFLFHMCTFHFIKKKQQKKIMSNVIISNTLKRRVVFIKCLVKKEKKRGKRFIVCSTAFKKNNLYLKKGHFDLNRTSGLLL